MSASFVVDGSNLKVAFEYIAPLDKMQEVATAAGHYLWKHGCGNHGSEEVPITFDDLSNQEKINLLDEHVKRVLLDLAKNYHVNARQIAERELATEYAEENLVID